MKKKRFFVSAYGKHAAIEYMNLGDLFLTAGFQLVGLHDIHLCVVGGFPDWLTRDDLIKTQLESITFYDWDFLKSGKLGV